MKKITLSQYLNPSKFSTKEVKAALELFVKYEVLLKTKKNGQDAYIENPAFRKLSSERQERIFSIIQAEETMS